MDRVRITVNLTIAAITVGAITTLIIQGSQSYLWIMGAAIAAILISSAYDNYRKDKERPPHSPDEEAKESVTAGPGSKDGTRTPITEALTTATGTGLRDWRYTIVISSLVISLIGVYAGIDPIRVVWDVGEYQTAGLSWVRIFAFLRLPGSLATPPSTAAGSCVGGAVLPSPGPVSPAARLPPARAFPSGSVTSGPTGPKMSLLGSSSTALSARSTRLSAAFSLRSCPVPHCGQLQWASR